MTNHRKYVVPLLACTVALSGCGAADEIKQGTKQGFEQGKREGMMQVLARVAIAEKSGLSIPKDLDCTVSPAPSGKTATPVSCTGTTTDGKAIALTGTITETAPLEKGDFVRGDFTATVGGKRVLKTSCIGPAC